MEMLLHWAKVLGIHKEYIQSIIFLTLDEVQEYMFIAFSRFANTAQTQFLDS